MRYSMRYSSRQSAGTAGQHTSMTNREAKRAIQPEAVPQSGASLQKPPVAIRKPEEHVIHNDVRRDDYGWLRNKSDAAVIAYLSEENAYTDAVMRGTEPL